VRVDFNVPLNKDNNIADPSRILETLPTIHFILENGGIPILMSHFGRPDGKACPSLSLKPCADYLKKMLKGYNVYFSQSCCDDATVKLASTLKPGDVLSRKPTIS
jgi:3-phosphoglycerate kinase